MPRRRLTAEERKLNRQRPELSPDRPVHVAIRVRDGTLRLRFKKCFRIVRTALVAASLKIRFRLLAYSVQGNHLHLIAEADDKFALSRAMRSLSIRIAKRINQLMQTRGQRIPKRYMLSVLKTKCDVNRALAYVLNNYRRHAAQGRRRLRDGWIDPCSSAVWFEHWSTPPTPTSDPCPDIPRGTVTPQSTILLHGWKVHGLIDPSYVPGPFRDRAKVTEKSVTVRTK
jgi:REP element-mobilizing transposase RayT